MGAEQEQYTFCPKVRSYGFVFPLSSVHVNTNRHGVTAVSVKDDMIVINKNKK